MVIRRYQLVLYLFTLLLVGSTLVTSDSCGGCNGDRGVCKNGKCDCVIFSEGEHCDILWNKNQQFNVVFSIYSAVFMSGHFALVVFAIQQFVLTITLAGERGWQKWSLVTFILIAAMAGGTLRILEMGLGCGNGRDYAPVVLMDLLYDMPLVIWAAGGFMLFLQWIQLQEQSGMKQLKTLAHLRPILIAFIVACLVIVPPLSVWTTMSNSTASALAYDAFYIILFLTLIGILTFYGIRLIRIMRSIWTETKSQGHRVFLKKITTYVIALDVILSLSIIVIIIYTLVNAGKDKWKWIGFHTMIRILESGTVFCTLLFVRKRKPAHYGSNHSGTSGASRYSTHSISQAEETVAQRFKHLRIGNNNNEISITEEEPESNNNNNQQADRAGPMLMLPQYVQIEDNNAEEKQDSNDAQQVTIVAEIELKTQNDSTDHSDSDSQ